MSLNNSRNSNLVSPLLLSYLNNNQNNHENILFNNNENDGGLYADVLANNFIIYASFYYGNEKI